MVVEAAEFLTRSEEFGKKNLRVLRGFQKKELIGNFARKRACSPLLLDDSKSTVTSKSQKDWSKKIRGERREKHSKWTVM